MKNNIIKLIVCIFLFNTQLNAQEFKFETEYIEILNEIEIIKAGKGKATTINGDIEIEANNFEYIKNLNKLVASGNGKILIKSKSLIIEFDNSIFDQKNRTIKANGNVKVKKIDKKIILESEKIFYDRISSKISSKTKSVLTDNSKNFYTFDNFIYNIEEDLLKVNNLFFNDANNNTFSTEFAFIGLDDRKIIAKDVTLNFKEPNSGDNKLRIKGNSLKNTVKLTEITNGIFTSCEERKECVPWKISSKKIIHDKKKKTIYYDDAVLRVYNVPVLYFPKFFHPDPTVERKSGFLVPSFNNSANSPSHVNIPYFLAISENKDATFFPRFYDENNFLFQSEYRQKNKRSNHIADLSYYYKNNANSNNHFFYKYNRNLDFLNFNDSKVNLNIQSSSKRNYLQNNNIETSFVSDYDVLENSLGINMYSSNSSIELDAIAYENFTKERDKYEYILPRLRLTKQINNIGNLDSNLKIDSESFIKNYNGNIYEYVNINDFNFNSFSKPNNYGFYNNQEILLKNSNTDSKNSNLFDDKKNFYVSGMYQYNSSFPLIKKNDRFHKIINPKLSFRVAPEHTKNEADKVKFIDIDNVYSLNRASSNEAIEGGISIIYGNEYKIFDLENSREIFDFKIANNFRFKENENLPRNNQINQKISNIFSKISYKPIDSISLEYKSSVKNNLDELTYENYITEFKINNFVTKFDYLNNNFLDQNSYISNNTNYKINNSNSLQFSTRKNKTDDLTEFYNLAYQYRNDCLIASLEFNKNFYNDSDLKPNESLIFKLTLTPIGGTTSSPNLKN